MCLFYDTVHCAGRKIFRRMAGNSDPAGFLWVLVLAMTPLCCDKEPSVVLYHFNNLTDFQDGFPNIPDLSWTFLHIRFLLSDTLDKGICRHRLSLRIFPREAGKAGLKKELIVFPEQGRVLPADPPAPDEQSAGDHQHDPGDPSHDNNRGRPTAVRRNRFCRSRRRFGL